MYTYLSLSISIKKLFKLLYILPSTSWLLFYVVYYNETPTTILPSVFPKALT